MNEEGEKEKAIDLAMLQIERQHGKGAIMRFNSDQVVPVEAIPTGSIALDIALGVGGIPRGRIIEMFGMESSGKTTLALHVIAEAQKLGGVAAFIDVEHALDPVYTRNICVDMDSLHISQPDTGEQALDIVETLIRSGAIDVIVVDSVAALTPEAEIGLALKFHASVRLEIKRAETLKDGNEAVGSRTKAKVVKNKVAPPFIETEFDIVFGEGISKEADLIDVGIDREIVRKSGAWFYYGDERLGQGKANAIGYLKENLEIAGEIEAKIRQTLNLTGKPADISDSVDITEDLEAGLTV